MHRLLILLLLTSCATAPVEFQDPLVPDTEVVTRVVDGDTFVVSKNHVRIIGIDTPEKEECYYEESSAYLSKLIFNIGNIP